MIKQIDLEGVKSFVKTQVTTYPNGVIYAIVENNTVNWMVSSDKLNIDMLNEGKTLRHDIITNTISTKREQSVTLTDDENRKQYKIAAVPIMNDATLECSGVFLTVTPKIHPLQGAFRYMAPMINQLFDEGVYTCLTDTEEILDKLGSENYDIPDMGVGYDISGMSITTKVLRTGKFVREDDDTLSYGPPIRCFVTPIFDEDTKDVIGTINIVRKKETELNLKNTSINLEKQLTEVSATIQELAAASSIIHANEIEVNSEIEEITVMAQKINKVTDIIKSIADSTNMLGLNASIEAARAGNAGRGFSVVASEIKKLSDQSKSTIPKIKKLTDDITAIVEKTKNNSNHSLVSSQEQVAATEEITATIEEIQAVSVELMNIAKVI